jgi:hypothetical protein
VRCREIGAECRDFVYKDEVHNWFNNSPHQEYRTHNVNAFLIDIGFLDRQPVVPMPHKDISDRRSEIQQGKSGAWTITGNASRYSAMRLEQPVQRSARLQHFRHRRFSC